MSALPRDPQVDSALALFKDGYEFISRRCRRWGTDAFAARLLTNDVVCMTGPDAAREFYDAALFERAGVMPLRIQRTLTGENGVQSLDGDLHAHRKAAFMSLMTRESVDTLVRKAGKRWDAAIGHWREQPSVNLFEQSQLVLCRAACAWAGVPLADFEAAARTRDLAAMVDTFGAIGIRYWQGKRARARSERWLGAVIERVRTRSFTAAPNTALHTWAWHRSADGALLPSKVAAVELLNVLRPIVGVSYHVAFAAAALHKHPQHRERLRATENGFDELFAQEVRRFYPFAPFVGARTRSEFDSATGYKIPAGRLVLLDIYGINRDPRLWLQPERFAPDRFQRRALGDFDFIPQGGGDPAQGHRCAGEAITLSLLTQAVNVLARVVSFELPEQDLSYNLARMPTYPRSGVVITAVRQERSAAEEEPSGKVVKLRRLR